MSKRSGDPRPFRRWHRLPLRRTPVDAPFRWLPRHGDPSCVIEWVSQNMIRSVAFLPIYTAIVVTITLVVDVVTR